MTLGGPDICSRHLLAGGMLEQKDCRIADALRTVRHTTTGSAGHAGEHHFAASRPNSLIWIPSGRRVSGKTCQG